jgi:hypothetical protein
LVVRAGYEQGTEGEEAGGELRKAEGQAGFAKPGHIPRSSPAAGTEVSMRLVMRLWRSFKKVTVGAGEHR